MLRLRRPRCILACLIGLIFMLACGPCGWLSQGRVALPDRPVRVTHEAAQRLEDKLKGAWESQGDGQFRLQVTDEELTSYLNMRLSGQDSIPLQQPRVWLTRGLIYVAGELSGPDLALSGQAALVLSAEVVDERLSLRIRQASVGLIPIPGPLTSSLEDTINSALAQAQLNVRVLQLEILEGEAILVAAPD